MASSLAIPTGFKNSTSGDINAAVNGIISANHRHQINKDYTFYKTKGNPYAHLILRGGSEGPNYDSKSIQKARELLENAGLTKNIIIDCSHANSSKNYREQKNVAEKVLSMGDPDVIGLMLESNLKEGKQEITSELEYGVSITDACIGWEDTAQIVMGAYNG